MAMHGIVTPRNRWQQKRRPAGLLWVIFATALSACSGSSFVQEPIAEAQPESNLVKSLVMRGSENVGALAAESNQQRAPLVMPTTTATTPAALPTPISADDGAAQSDFPVNPEDVQVVFPDARNEDGVRVGSAGAQARQLPIKQRRQTMRDLTDFDNDDGRLTPGERREAYRKFNDIKEATDALQVAGPQERRFLTDPPTRFMTPSQNAEFALPDQPRDGEQRSRCDLIEPEDRAQHHCP